MSEMTCLEAAGALWFAHLFCQMGLAGQAFSPAYLFSSRDSQDRPKSIVYGRAARAFGNYVENLVAFAVIDLALIVVHRDAGWAPTVWVAARAIYLPLYLFNVIYARTAAAGIAMISLLVMLWDLTFGH
ncbi:MAG TPA: MAPEG family protein [Caulobacteraceae bacterium]